MTCPSPQPTAKASRLNALLRPWWLVCLSIGPMVTSPVTQAEERLSLPFATDHAGSATKTTLDAEEGVEINQQTGEVVATGHPRLQHGNWTLTAERLTAYFDSQRKGDDSPLASLKADGNVTMQAPGRTATGDTAWYNRDQGTVVLQGNVRLFDGNSQLQAPQVVFHIGDQSVSVTRGQDQRPRALLAE